MNPDELTEPQNEQLGGGSLIRRRDQAPLRLPAPRTSLRQAPDQSDAGGENLATQHASLG